LRTPIFKFLKKLKIYLRRSETEYTGRSLSQLKGGGPMSVVNLYGYKVLVHSLRSYQ